MKLYELTKTYQEMLDLDVSEEDLLLMLQSLEGTIKEKADNIGKLLNSLELEQTVYKAEIDRLKAKADKASKKNGNLKQFLSDSLKSMDINKLECDLFKISFRKSQTVEFDDKDVIPSTYKKSETVEKIDKNALKKDLKLGVVPGCHLQDHSNIQIK